MRLLLALLLIMLVPGAHALAVSEPEPLPALVPGEVYPVAFSVTVSCSAVIREALPGPAATLTVTPATPAGFSIMGPQTYAVSRDGCDPTGSRVVEVAFNLTASMQAPAHEEVDLGFEVMLGDDPEETEAFMMRVVPAFKVVLEASTTTPVQQAAPQKTIPFDIEIKYVANGRVMFEFTSAESDAGRILMPAPVIADRGNGSTVATAYYQTPFENGANNAEEQFQISVHARSAYEDTTFASQDVEFIAKTRGMYVPGPMALLPAGLLLAAFLRRR